MSKQYYNLKINNNEPLYLIDFNGFLIKMFKNDVDIDLLEGIYFVSRDASSNKYQINLNNDLDLDNLNDLVIVSNAEIKERMLFNLEGDFG